MSASSIRRATRVVPAHLIMLSGLVVFVLGGRRWRASHRRIRSISTGASFPRKFSSSPPLGVPGGKGWNDPTWSLSALLVCYAAFPFLWRAFSRIKSPVVSLIAAFVRAGPAADVAANLILHRDVFQIPQEIGALRALPLFIAGIMVARFSEKVAIAPWLAKTAGIGALVTLVTLQAIGRYDFVSIVLIGVLVLSAGAWPVKKPSYLLEKGAIVSFSLFITNEPVRIVLFGFFHVIEKKLHASVCPCCGPSG